MNTNSANLVAFPPIGGTNLLCVLKIRKSYRIVARDKYVSGADVAMDPAKRVESSKDCNKALSMAEDT